MLTFVLMKSQDSELLKKYNVSGPRYTSYPAVPHWKNDVDQESWKNLVTTSFEKHSDEGISLYIHLPYCEALCTYCGCNKVITTNHSVEKPYIETVLKEWRMYKKLLKNQKIKIKELHLGGGTPTFFSPENLNRLIELILVGCEVADDHEFSIEVHPNYTTKEQIETLHKLGFNRISIGVQDVDPVVQKAINRIQSIEQVERVTNWSRDLGFKSVNFDLIYGLPFQKEESIRATIEEVKRLRPDRIAFYSYAHVPWKSRAQRLFTEEDLPKGEEKQRLFEIGQDYLLDVGYNRIGMDHFALPEDELAIAYSKGKMHRNFMGYTTQKTTLLIGLGVSSISDSWTGYMQNEKTIKGYTERVEKGEFPIHKGHQLSNSDLEMRQYILSAMCQFKVIFEPGSYNLQIDEVKSRLKEMEKDGLVGVFDNGILLSHKGRTYVRNVCMALDPLLWGQNSATQLFSSTI